MKQFKKWAEREYPFRARFLASILAGFLFALLIPFLLARVALVLDRSIGFPSFGYGLPSLLVGSTLIILGLIYAFWSIAAQLLHARGTPLPMMATQKLLIAGPFRHCRNPMSFGTILLYLGIGIFVGSTSAVVFVLIFTILLVGYIKGVEESELEARFGEEYIRYKEETPFLIPRVFSSRSSNESQDQMMDVSDV